MAGYQGLIKEGLPAPLHLLPVVCNSPFGKILMVAFTWASSDTDTGRTFLDRVSSFGHVVMTNVVETSIPDWQEASVAALPKSMFGIYNQKSCRVYELTDEVA